MVQKDKLNERSSLEDIRRLAREAAEKLRYYDLFGARAVEYHKLTSIRKLAEGLGLVLRIDPMARSRGKLINNREIVVRSTSHSSDKMVMLHEIGHAVLLRDYAAFASQLELKYHEVFASNFAMCMLLPESNIDEFRTAFHAIDSVRSLNQTATSFRFSNSDFLQLAAQPDGPLIGQDKIWLTVKHSPDRVTHHDPTLRVTAAYCDPSRWFVITNQKVEHFFENLNYFYDVEIGSEVNRDNIPMRLLRVDPIGPKYNPVTVRVNAKLFGLRAVRGESGAHILMLVIPNS